MSCNDTTIIHIETNANKIQKAAKATFEMHHNDNEMINV